MTSENALKRAGDLTAILTYVLGAVFLLMAILPENRWWGINHLYFLSLPVRIAYAVFLIAALLPRTRRLLSAAGHRCDALPDFVRVTSVIAAGLALFIAFRVAVHSLGDGYQRAYQIEFGKIFYAPEMLDFAIHALLYRAVNAFYSVGAATVVAATSIAAGLVFIIFLFRYAASFEGNISLAFGAVISMGCSQFFFGYVESYTLVLVFSVWYIFLAFRIVEHNRGSFPGLSAVYLAAGLSHQMALILLPSYIYLAVLIIRASGRRYLLMIPVAAVACLPYVIPAALNQLLGKTSPRGLTDYLLPLVGESDAVFSINHLHGIINEFVLAAPVVIMALPLVILAVRQKGHRLLLLSLCLPGGLFVLLFNPELTMPRDWDLLAVPVVIGVLPLLIVLFQRLGDWPTMIRGRVVAAVLVAVVMTGSWVALNTSRDSNLARAEYVLKYAEKGQRYGYELLAYYYGRRGDYEDELRMLEAIDIADRTPRVYGKMSQALYALKRYDEAYSFAQVGVMHSIPNKLNAFMAGLTAYDRGEYLRAVYYLGAAVAMDPDNYPWVCRFGDALVRVDSINRGINVYNQALALDPNSAEAYAGLGEAYLFKQDYKRARAFCVDALKRNPRLLRGQQLWDTLQVILGDGDK